MSYQFPKKSSYCVERPHYSVTKAFEGPLVCVVVMTKLPLRRLGTYFEMNDLRY